MKDGSPLRYDADTIRAIATEAVKDVYQYGASITGDPFKELRQQRADAFRTAYGSDSEGHANEFPYFIGVFDTVAALGVARPVRIALGAAAGVVTLAIAALVSWLLAKWFFSFTAWFVALCLLPAAGTLFGYLKTHLRYHPVLKRFFLSDWSMKFYDNKLNRRVGYARHALAIDETRADFDYVHWVFDGDDRQRSADEPELLRQIWFAGDHSDIGGSYVENESRLSDNSLQWLVEQIREVPHPLQFDELVLRRFPSPIGPQHDECRKGFSGLWRKMGMKWTAKDRSIKPDAPLHPSVLQRFAAPPVLNYDKMEPYRPESLRQHDQVKHFY